MYKKLIFFFFCFFLLTPAYGQEALNLQQTLEKGLKDNPSLQAYKQALEASEYNLKAKRGSFGPSLTTNYSYLHLDEEPRSQGQKAGDQDLWTLNLNLSQPLFTGFYLLNDYQKAKLEKEQASLRLKQARIELAYKIEESFFNFLKAQAEVKSALKSTERLKSHLQVVTNFYNVGLKPKIEVLQAQVELSQAEQYLIAAQNQQKTQAALLNSLLNIPITQEQNYIGELNFLPLNLSLEECLQEAWKNRPDLILAQKSVEIAHKEKKLALSSFYPQVEADFDYYRYGKDPRVNGTKFKDPSQWQVSVGLKWNLFESGQSFYKVKQAQSNIFRLESEYQNLKNTLSFEVKAAYLKVQSQKQSIIVAKKGLAEAEEGFRLAQARYEAKVGTNTDVLDAQARLSKAEANYIQAMADYLIALANLNKAMGKEEFSF